MNWIHLGHDMDRWMAAVNAAMNRRFHWSKGSFFISGGAAGFSRRTLLRGVGYQQSAPKTADACPRVENTKRKITYPISDTEAEIPDCLSLLTWSMFMQLCNEQNCVRIRRFSYQLYKSTSWDKETFDGIFHTHMWRKFHNTIYKYAYLFRQWKLCLFSMHGIIHSTVFWHVSMWLSNNWQIYY